MMFDYHPSRIKSNQCRNRHTHTRTRTHTGTCNFLFIASFVPANILCINKWPFESERDVPHVNDTRAQRHRALKKGSNLYNCEEEGGEERIGGFPLPDQFPYSTEGGRGMGALKLRP